MRVAAVIVGPDKINIAAKMNVFWVCRFFFFFYQAKAFINFIELYNRKGRI